MKEYYFKDKISEEVLCNYLSRASTISPIVGEGKAYKPCIGEYILSAGLKYIARAATCWTPSLADIETFPEQKKYIEDIHKLDSDIVFEACVFECINKNVNYIPIPGWVFEAFEKDDEKRCFSFDKMCFPDGEALNQWGKDTTVPDITQLETRMFFYYRSCEYINLGYEALHMGQVHWIGMHDDNFTYWTELLKMIREYAKKNARRGFVFINAHTHGIVGADKKLLFDFHMFPSRPMADGTQKPHLPEEGNPQRASFARGHVDSIYGKSMGGLTHSGWSCESLPYLVELDNFANDVEALNIPKPQDARCWGMDEIVWFAMQPRDYRAEFLRYAYDWVVNDSGGKGFFCVPGERVSHFYDVADIPDNCYYVYDSSVHPLGFGDDAVIKEILKNN